MRLRVCVTAVLAQLTAFAMLGPSAFGAEPEFGRYALESVSSGLASSQAGAHADFTTTFRLTSDENNPYALTRRIEVKLPHGLFGNPRALSTCSDLEFGDTSKSSKCPPESQVGVTEITLGGADAGTFTEPIYNMTVPNGGLVARFGFYAAGYPGFIGVRLDPADESLIATVEGAPAAAALIGASTTFWGVPSSPAHDFQRMTPDEAGVGDTPPRRSSTLPEVPFMTNPASCDETREVGFALTSYQLPESAALDSAPFPAVTGCGLVGFAPQTSARPTSEQAYTGTGLDYEARFPAKGLEFGSLLYGSEAKRVEVTLPEGMTINPSEAIGLGVCSEADLARETYDSAPNVGCPETSKVGTITAPTPVLDRTPEGALYIATPYANPFHTLLALYLVLKVPDRGVLVKVAGKVVPDSVTGRLMSVFDDIPQLPVGSFKLHFREGARAPLVTPPVCGSFTTVSRMEPWSAPGAAVTTESGFAITKGIDDGPCPSGAVPPFSPTLVAGTNNNLAGAYSPLYLRIERNDGEQEITGLAMKLPPGLTGKLTGIPFCSEADIERARQQTGAEAESDPACPAASEIGHTISEAGVGSVLAQTPGSLYLAGPFEGAPFSVVDVTAAKVGPFDLGTVVVHLPLNVDPLTAQVSIPSGPADQIPHILDGIVIHLRKIRVYIDRQHFMLNPTSCKPMSLSATVTGSGANFASAADDVPFTASNRFQAAECAHLTFNPTFEATTQGKTSRRLGASLKVKLTYPKGSIGKAANIHEVEVDLPKQLPSRLSTLQQACTDRVFESNPAACPVASRVGMAKAVTPILPVPLTGPAYFVSHGGAKFPELIIVLQGYGVTVDLHGETFISNAGVTSSTFRAVPDQPVTSFELTLPESKYSALDAPGNKLCSKTLVMPTRFIAQNGATHTQKTKIKVTGCSDKLSVVSRKLKGHTVTLKVVVPAAGKLKASGKGLSSSSASSTGRGSVTLELQEKHAGKLSTKVSLTFTPSKGKNRKRQTKTLSVKFKAPKHAK